MYYLILFSLGFIYTKKLVLLIASGGKKWGFHYHYDHYGWEKVGISGGEKWGKMVQGDYPPSQAPLTF